MKKKILIGLGVFFALVIAGIAALALHFMPILKIIDPSLLTFSNMKAVYIAMTMDDEQREERLKTLDEDLANEVKNYVSAEVRDFTDEEKQQIESGEKTKTEIIAQIITESVNGETNTAPEEKETVKTDVSGSKNENKADEKKDTPQAEQKPKGETADEIVARHIAKLYQYSGEFEGRVSALKERARAYMNAYKASHPGITWRDAKIATMNNLMSEATRIENDCYAKVDAEIALLQSELKAINADLSVVNTVRTAAYNEMEVKKSKIAAEGRAELNS